MGWQGGENGQKRADCGLVGVVSWGSVSHPTPSHRAPLSLQSPPLSTTLFHILHLSYAVSIGIFEVLVGKVVRLQPEGRGPTPRRCSRLRYKGLGLPGWFTSA